MQITRIKVEAYKCLKNFEIEFDLHDDDTDNLFLIVGENGSGKSSLYELIVQIFMSFDSPAVKRDMINTDYEIEYIHAGSRYCIIKCGEKYTLKDNNSVICVNKFDSFRDLLKKSRNKYLPLRIVGYSCSQNESLVALQDKMSANYKSTCTKYLNTLMRKMMFEDVSDVNESDFYPIRYIFSKELMLNAIAIALFAMEDNQANAIKKLLHLDKINLITLKIKNTRIGEIAKSNFPLAHDALFVLNAYCEMIDHGIASLIDMDFSNEYDGECILYIRLPDFANIDAVSLFDFFEKLSTVFEADLQVEFGIGNEKVSICDLSDGQKQLLQVLGTILVCQNNGILVMLDEPDCHLNPKWQYELNTQIKKILSTTQDAQAIVMTNNPLTINGISKEHLKILELCQNGQDHNGNCHTTIYEPDQDTFGMGIDGILQSEYFGLKQSYDMATSQKFIERRELYLKTVEMASSQEEKQKLLELTKELGGLPFANNTIDFLYDDFYLEYMGTEYYHKQYLTSEEVNKRKQNIVGILAKLFEDKE